VKVYVYPSDVYGCGHYRLIWPARAAAGQGHDVTVVMPEERKALVLLNQQREPIGERFPADADVVVLQRPTHQYLAATVPMLRARGVAVVIDMDDDLRHINPQNRAFSALVSEFRQQHPRSPWLTMTAPNLHSRAAVEQACRDATVVTVSTPPLRDRYGAHGRCAILPNCVPESYLQVPRVDSDTIGWGGVVVVHPHDLQAVGPTIARLVNEEGIRFETVGEVMGVAKALGLREDPPSPGDVALDDWPTAIARFGIGIAPLEPTAFNRAKSWLKPLELAAVGVPWVASDLPEYQRLHALGAGAVAARPKEWRARLLELVRDPARRAEQSEAGRAVATALTIEAHAWRWAEAWSAAADLQQGREPVPVG
jgi:glycosyltransferase involved in cell wall biosynthesis